MRKLPIAVVFAFTLLPATGYAQTLLGVYYGNQGWAMNDVKALETWQGKKHAVVNLFTDWTSTTKVMNNLFGQQLPNIWSNGNVPMITWEPFTGGKTPNDVEARIAAGQYDSYVTTWAGRLKTFLAGPDKIWGSGDDRRVYIRLGHEMNGNWYPWSPAVGGNMAADYVAMWQRVVGIFQSMGLDARTVQWVWCVNADDVGGFAAEDFYPGDTYVDWVAIDGYNWGASQSWSSWETPNQVFDDMLARVRKISSKPVAFTEFASTSSTTAGNSVPAKSAWINSLSTYVTANNIKMVCWFNTDKETDWAVFGGANGDGAFKSGRTTYKTYSTYKTAISTNAFISSTASDERLLSDSQFSGD